MVWKKQSRLDPDYKEFRAAVLKRDKHMCQMPYCESKRGLVVHHIKSYAKSPFLRTDPENGITLCRKCHKLTFGRESQYSHLFLSIIYNNGLSDDGKKSKT